MHKRKYQVRMNGRHVGYVYARNHTEARDAASVKFNASPRCQLDVIRANI